jgi:hypothetical protein
MHLFLQDDGSICFWQGKEHDDRADTCKNHHDPEYPTPSKVTFYHAVAIVNGSKSMESRKRTIRPL